MIQATHGIVLTHIRYGESSAIVHIYTKSFGMQSYMVNGAYGRKKRSNFQLLQPLNLLEMEVNHRVDKDLQRIREFKVSPPMMRIPFSQSRRAQAFLITEILSRTLRSEGMNISLFEFLEQGILALDSEINGLENFHIWRLFNWTRYFGFLPNNNFSDKFPWFDIMEGCFVSSEPAHPYYLKQDGSLLMKNLFSTTLEELPSIARNVAQRRALLYAMAQFYEIHHQGVGKIRSLQVLEELFKI